jgi:hypothetical protein
VLTGGRNSGFKGRWHGQRLAQRKLRRFRGLHRVGGTRPVVGQEQGTSIQLQNQIKLAPEGYSAKSVYYGREEWYSSVPPFFCNRSGRQNPFQAAWRRRKWPFSHRIRIPIGTIVCARNRRSSFLSRPVRPVGRRSYREICFPPFGWRRQPEGQGSAPLLERRRWARDSPRRSIEANWRTCAKRLTTEEKACWQPFRT